MSRCGRMQVTAFRGESKTSLATQLASTQIKKIIYAGGYMSYSLNS